MDPSGIIYLPDGVTRVHSLASQDWVGMLNTTTNNQITVATQAGPQGMCATLNTLYVKNDTDGSVTVMDISGYMNSGATPEVQHVPTVTP